MSDTDRELKELYSMVRDLEHSTSVEAVKLTNKIENFKQIKKDVEVFEKVLNDPNDGLYKRINDIVYDIKTIAQNQQTLINSVNNLEKKVNEIQTTRKNLLKIAGDSLEKLDSTIKISQNSKKILWTFFLAAVTMAGERLFDIIKLF